MATLLNLLYQYTWYYSNNLGYVYSSSNKVLPFYYSIARNYLGSIYSACISTFFALSTLFGFVCLSSRQRHIRNLWPSASSATTPHLALKTYMITVDICVQLTHQPPENIIIDALELLRKMGERAHEAHIARQEKKKKLSLIHFKSRPLHNV